MRKSIDGLAGIIKLHFGMGSFASSLFLFCGKRRDRLKALIWENDGFLLLYKCLENGSYRWPRNEIQARHISLQELRWLLKGLEIDQPKAIKEVKPGDFC